MQHTPATAYANDVNNGRYTPLPEHLRLRRVCIVLRHGDRTPIAANVGSVVEDSEDARRFWRSKMPDDREVDRLNTLFTKEGPATSSDDDAIPYGQLTVLGAQQLRQLGEKLRERLVGTYALLSPTPQPSELWLRATNIRRTQQSLQNLLLGLYPELDNGNAPSGIKVRVYEREHETMIPNPNGRCERHDEIIREIETLRLDPHQFNLKRHLLTSDNNSSRFDFSGFESTIRRLVGVADGDPVNWQVIREVLTCNSVHDGPVVEQANAMLDTQEGVSVLEALTDYSAWLWGQLYRNEELSMLAVGRLLYEILMDMKPSEELAARNGELAHIKKCPDTAKLVVYSGHDSTLVPLMCAFGIYEDVWPPYASHLQLELAEDVNTSRWFVRLVYNDAEVIPQGESEAWCSLEKFQERMQSFIPTDYEEQCKPKHAEEPLLSDKCHSLADDVSTTIR